MKNVNELRNELSDVFAGLRAGSIKHSDAAELANLAGKMINSAKVQLEYYALRKEAPVIPFLMSEKLPNKASEKKELANG
jgi:hypothetical protein